MPIGFLPAERERLSRFFPSTFRTMISFCWLSDDDHGVINQQREDATRLGFALLAQCCAIWGLRRMTSV